jgi:hypothetical protein
VVAVELYVQRDTRPREAFAVRQGRAACPAVTAQDLAWPEGRKPGPAGPGGVLYARGAD